MRPPVLALVLAASPLLATRVDAAPTPRPEQRLEAGVFMEALTEVNLRGATLARGARVRVIDVAKRGSAPVAASLELADGHVLKDVSLKAIVGKFRIEKL